MISVEQWRMSVGSFSATIIKTRLRKEKTTSNQRRHYIWLLVITAYLSSSMISTLLVIGGVEQNPGPTHDSNEGLTAQTQQAEALKEKGNECFKQKEYNKAIHFYTKALLLDPKNAGYYNNRSHVNLKVKNFDDALRDASEAIACDKNNFKAYYRRAEANMALRRYEKSFADYGMTMTMLESNEPNAANLNYLEITRGKLAELNKIVKGAHQGDSSTCIDSSFHHMENYNPSTSTTSTSTHNTNQPQLLPTTTTTSVSTIEQNKPTSNQGNDQGSSKQATGTSVISDMHCACKRHRLKLGSMDIGNKFKDPGNGVFDNTSIELKDTEHGKYIYNQIETLLRKQYYDVLDGSRSKLVAFPPKFVYHFPNDSQKEAAMQYEKVGPAWKRVKELEKLKAQENQRERKFIKEILKHKETQGAEEKIFNSLFQLLFYYKGLFLHSYRPRNYLQPFILKAKENRKSISPVGLTELEKKLLHVSNIKFSELEKWVNEQMEKLQEKQNEQQNEGTNDGRISGEVIKNAVEFGEHPKERNDQFNKLSIKFKEYEKVEIQGKYEFALDAEGKKKKRFYTRDHILRILTHSEYERLLYFEDEFDILVVLPHLKMFLNVEVKKQMANKKENKMLANAAKQLRKRAEYVSRIHGSLLCQGWKYLKVASIQPGNLEWDEICDHCKKFILISGTPEEEENQLETLWSILNQKPSFEADAITNQEYIHLFSRIVGFSELSLYTQKLPGAWEQIQGKGVNHNIVAGFTPDTPLKFGDKDWQTFMTNTKIGKHVFRHGDMMGRPHDWYKILSLNEDQLALLTDPDKRLLIFVNDYGSGKTLVCKKKAIQIDSDGSNHKPVFYISLLASDRKGKPRPFRHVFDFCTKTCDFKQTNVKAIDVQDLCHHYRHTTKYKRSDVNVYELALHYMRDCPDAHYILDEVPILVNKASHNYDAKSIQQAHYFLTQCHGLIMEENNFWLSFQSNTTADIIDAKATFGPSLQEMKETLKKNGFIFPILRANMRNSQPISNVTVNQEGSRYYKMSGQIEILTSSVSGQTPLLIPVNQKDVGKRLGNVLKCALTYTETNNQNWVVLHDGRTFSSHEIQNVLCNITNNGIQIYDPEKDEETSINNLTHFLNHPKQILVIQDYLFTGCESSNIIYLNSDRGFVDQPIRCSLLRAVEHLILIFVINNEYGYYNNFNGFNLEPTFLKCVNQIETAWKCNTCHIRYLCKSCSIGCHKSHQLKQVSNRHSIKICQCNASSTCKIYHNRF